MEERDKKQKLISEASQQRLKDELEKKIRRMEAAEKRRQSFLSQAVSIGTLGLLFVLPPVAGAYLGRWLDDLCSGYSIRWTISFILIGVVCGMINVYLFIRE